jgi:hypothetical protein
LRCRKVEEESIPLFLAYSVEKLVAEAAVIAALFSIRVA